MIQFVLSSAVKVLIQNQRYQNIFIFKPKNWKPNLNIEEQKQKQTVWTYSNPNKLFKKKLNFSEPTWL